MCDRLAPFSIVPVRSFSDRFTPAKFEFVRSCPDMLVPSRLAKANLTSVSFASFKLALLRSALSKIAFLRSKPSKFFPEKSAAAAYITN